jgi:hypothetical protein
MNDTLPVGFRALIHPYTGDLTQVAPPVSPGYGADLTAVVRGEKGRFFVKGMRNRPGGRLDSLVRERLINPFVRPVAPALRWSAEDDAWTALGFAVVDGRPSDFVPGSPDLPAIVALLDRIADLPLPDVARAWTETRWDRYTAGPAEAELFRGDELHDQAGRVDERGAPGRPGPVDGPHPVRADHQVVLVDVGVEQGVAAE